MMRIVAARRTLASNIIVNADSTGGKLGTAVGVVYGGIRGALAVGLLISCSFRRSK
jgi:hypothetical protein